MTPTPVSALAKKKKLHHIMVLQDSVYLSYQNVLKVQMEREMGVQGVY